MGMLQLLHEAEKKRLISPSDGKKLLQSALSDDAMLRRIASESDQVPKPAPVIKPSKPRKKPRQPEPTPVDDDSVDADDDDDKDDDDDDDTDGETPAEERADVTHEQIAAKMGFSQWLGQQTGPTIRRAPVFSPPSARADVTAEELTARMNFHSLVKQLNRK